MLIIILIAVLAIIAIITLLASRRKDKYQQIARLFFYPRPMFGADQRRFESWRYGDWFVGERVNEAITAGKERYAHSQPRRGRHHR